MGLELERFEMKKKFKLKTYSLLTLYIIYRLDFSNFVQSKKAHIGEQSIQIGYIGNKTTGKNNGKCTCELTNQEPDVTNWSTESRADNLEQNYFHFCYLS